MCGRSQVENQLVAIHYGRHKSNKFSFTTVTITFRLVPNKPILQTVLSARDPFNKIVLSFPRSLRVLPRESGGGGGGGVQRVSLTLSDVFNYTKNLLSWTKNPGRNPLKFTRDPFSFTENPLNSVWNPLKMRLTVERKTQCHNIKFNIYHDKECCH